MANALDGVTVLEFASHLASAFAAVLMAEEGARTIKVEPPGGEPGRGGAHFHVVNRSKRSVLSKSPSCTPPAWCVRYRTR